MLSEACYVWNHALALQKRYYKIYGSYVSAVNMQKHFAKRIKRTFMHSQSVQEILQGLPTFLQTPFKEATKIQKAKRVQFFLLQARWVCDRRKRVSC